MQQRVEQQGDRPRAAGRDYHEGGVTVHVHNHWHLHLPGLPVDPHEPQAKVAPGCRRRRQRRGGDRSDGA